MKTFTIEEIKKAIPPLIKKASFYSGEMVNVSDLISELTKENTFVEGQVLFDDLDLEGEFFCYYNDANIENCRALSPAECGPHVVAMLEYLRTISDLSPTRKNILSNLPEGWK